MGRAFRHRYGLSNQGIGVGARPHEGGVGLGGARALSSILIPHQGALYMLTDEIYGYIIFSSPWYDDVSILLGGQAELLEGWLHEGGVLVQHVLKITATFLDVSQDTPCESGVCISVYEELHVEEVSKLGVVEDQDAFHQHHVRGVDRSHLSFNPAVRLE